MNLKSFAKRMREVARGIEINTTDRQRVAALIVNQTIVLATPVDTGRARGNWVASLGGPVTSILDTEDKSGQETISRNNSTIGRSKPHGDIWLSNNLPYISRLNEGSSSQAPAMFVEQAIQIGLRSSRSQKIVRRR
jgi:hypothetical protein